MPEALLMRIIRVSSNPDDVVLDPFSGSGTTVVAAAKLGRRYVGIDLSEQYVKHGRKRLREVKRAGDAVARCGGWTPLEVDTLASMYRETNTALPNLAGNGVAMDCFTRLLNIRLGASYTPDDVIAQLRNLERTNELPRLRNDRLLRPRETQSRAKPRKKSRTDPTLFDIEITPLEAEERNAPVERKRRVRAVG